jgi:3-oxoacyl-[acyl-carrier protein] reductase
MQKVVFISGASRGLGAIMAYRFASDGWKVAVNYHNDRTGAEKVVSKIEAMGGKALAVQGDVTKEAEVVFLAERVRKELGKVYALVNNAVAPHEGKTFEELKVEDYDQQYLCSVRAPLLLLEAFQNDMHAQKGGRIVNIGSDLQF